MDTQLRGPMPRARKPAQVPSECVPSTGYVPMAPMMPGEPEAPGVVEEPLGQPVGPALDHPFTGPVADGFGPGPDAPSTPMRAAGGTPGPGAPAHTAHAVAAPVPDSAALHAVPLHPAYAVMPSADSAESAAVPVHPLHASVPASDSAMVPAVPGQLAQPLETPMGHHVVAATAPADDIGHPAGHILTTARTDAVAPNSSVGGHDGSCCCCQCTGDDKAAQPDPGQQGDPSAQGDPSVQQSPDTTPPGNGSHDAAPDSTAGNTCSPDTGTAGKYDSPVQVATAPDTTSSADQLKPFSKSEKPQPMQSAMTVEGKPLSPTPGAQPQLMQAGKRVQDKPAPVTPGAEPQQPLARRLVVPEKMSPASFTKSVPAPQTGSGGSGDKGNGSGDKGNGSGGKGSDTGGQGSGSGDKGSDTGGKKGLPPVKATSGGGNLTFDEGQYRKLTGVVNDMDDSLTKNAASTPTMALDVDLTVHAGNSNWGPAGDVAAWTKNFGQSVAGVNEKMRVALSLMGNALTLATMVFKDTNDLAQMDFTTFVTEFPDLNTGGGQTNPGAYGAFGGGSTGGKN
ncbi:hypothetical protein [Amycolatopsis pigmentata]|uniref:Uncharacterized protein n=1 Tax=Amycolatopsis pigmentata TaxID=450801 RepID=A0ABW5G2G3_9PSEU